MSHKLLTPKFFLVLVCALMCIQQACDSSSCDQICVNGTFNEENCACTCDEGWVGWACDEPELPNVISAEIAYASTKQSYSTGDMHVRFVKNPGGLDTVVIDSEVSPNNWLYVFLVDENITRIQDKTFPVVGSGGAGTAWVQHYNQAQTEDHFTPNPLQSSGNLIVDALDFEDEFIRIRFNADLRVPPQTATCTNGVINFIR